MRVPLRRCPADIRCLQILSTVVVVFIVVVLLGKNVTVIINEKYIHHRVWRNTTQPCNTTLTTERGIIQAAVKATRASKIKPSERYKTAEWYKAAKEIQNDWQTRPRDFKCANISLVGNWPVCFDPPFRVTKPCLVYSFGIAFDFSFDNGMRKIGCEVHSFDPSMKMSDRVTETGVHFHNMGLSARNDDKFLPRQDTYVKDNQTWKLRTLKRAMKELHHTGRTLDVLKIDVESHEWDVVENILDEGLFNNVKQFLLEWHLFPDWPMRSDFKRCSKIYRRLIDSGLKKYYTSEHPQTLTPSDFNLQADTAHVNLKFIHKSHR